MMITGSSDSNSTLAEVVFLIESTAHISPYVESLKTNYIIPTLEYFSGVLPDERECGIENNPKSTLYGIVTFMSNDCKPDSATACYAPTSNSNIFLQWLDKIQYIGGGGSSSSHIVEGLSTAIDLLDDLRSLRDSLLETDNESSNPIKSAKHCILICNSTPYMEPAVENKTYFGYTIERLMEVMVEKNINFSIFSPRKINFLYKLFENSGGSLNSALTKNYARDRRHLVMLNGFQLQERPMSPSSQPSSTEQEKVHFALGSASVGAPQQQQQQQQPQTLKRPLSPSSNNQLYPNQQMRTGQMPMNMGQDSSGQFAQQHQKLQQDNMANLQARVGSPSVAGHWNANGSVPSPSQIQTRGPVPRQRASTPSQVINSTSMQNMQNPIPSPGQIPNLVPQVSPAAGPKPNAVNGPGGLRPSNPGLQQMRPQQMPSPFPPPQTPSPSQPQPSPMGLRAVPSPIQNSAPSPIAPNNYIQQQQINPIVHQQQQQQQQQMNQLNQMNANPNQMNIQQQQQQQQQQQPNTMQQSVPVMINSQRSRIWSGIVEYHEKLFPQASNQFQEKKLYHLECQITYQSNSNEPEFILERWPEKLVINTVPRYLMNRLSPIFKNSSYHVNFHFSDSIGYQKFFKAMTSNSVGCIQLPTSANIRIIIIMYMPEKKIFVGFIPHNQDEFMSSMKEVIESHKKEQHVKNQQKMLQSIANQQIQQQTLQQQQTNGPMSIQLTHGQMGQTQTTLVPGGNAGQLISSNSNVNAMFQLQMSSTASMQPNSNISTVSQSGQIMSQPQQQPNTSTSSMLLNQTLTGGSSVMPVVSQGNKVFITSSANNGNMVTGAGNTGMQITLQNPSVSTGVPIQSQPSATNQQSTVGNGSVSVTQTGQQFQMMANQSGQPINIVPNTSVSGGSNSGGGTGVPNQTSGGNGNFGQKGYVHQIDREQNLMNIKQLEMTLKEAQRKEMEYAAMIGSDPSKQAQMLANQQAMQQQQQQQTQPNNTVRQHLHNQLQQKQMNIHLQQQQQQQPNQAPNVQLTNNLQLRHLLQQQQQLRTMNPGTRMSSVSIPHQQQTQTQILIQQQQPQNQQYRFQAQQIQQQQSQPPQQTQVQVQGTQVTQQQQQQHGRFFDESPLY